MNINGQNSPLNVQLQWQQGIAAAKSQQSIEQPIFATPFSSQGDTASFTLFPSLTQSGSLMPLTLSPAFDQEQTTSQTGSEQGQEIGSEFSQNTGSSQDPLTQQMQALARKNLPSEGQALADQLANLDPASAEAQQVNAQIAALWTGSPQDLQKFQTFGSIKQIDSMAANLKNTLANLDPASAQAKQLQARLNALGNTESNLKISLQTQALAQQNLPPEGQALADQLANLDPASAEAQQVNARIAALWTGSPQELKTFQTLGAIRQINSMAASLNNMLANLDPASAQAQQIQARLDQLNNQAGTLQNGLNSTSGGQTQPYGSEANTEQQLVALKMLRMGQQNLPQEAQPLVEQLVNLEPDSAQAQQVSAQIAAQWTGSPQDLKTFQTLGAIRQIDSMANGLKNTLANLDPASDQAKLLQGRLAQLNNKRLSLQAQDLARRNLPTEAQPLADQLADLDPASAEAQQVNARIAALWTGSPQELKTFQTLGAIRQINSMAASLNNMLANLDPASAQAQQIQAQLDVLKAKRDSLQGQLQQPGNSGTVRIPTP